jgi:hypothetical protein
MRFVLLAGCLALAVTPPALARPAHKQALAHYFGSRLAKKLNDCRTCHLPERGDRPKEEADLEKPHNAFGARLAKVKRSLRAAGKSATIDACLDAVLDEDSDGDGASNLLELLIGRFPGDPDDRPTAAELTEARIQRVAFRRAKKGYPWQPFEAVRRPAVPTVNTAGWVRNPNDAFIAAEHEAFALTPRPAAARAVLLRRVYLDLIGLPPTPAELHAFLKDASPQAYEKVVDKLLASPQYGERWGRHWMDVWRYSDWAGYGAQVRDSQPHIWRWRDWIVDSLNADRGYDRMVVDMLAGDERAPDDPQALVATGYLVRNFKLLSREKWMQDTVEHTFAAFQGLTLQCARCHDHMYDPLLQRDYYEVRAIFEPYNVRTDHLPGKLDLKNDGLVRVFDAKPDVPTYLFVRGDDRNPDKSKPLPPGVPDALGGRYAPAPVTLPRSAVAPEKRDFVLRDLRQAADQSAMTARAAYHAALQTTAFHLTQALAPSVLARVAALRRLSTSLDDLTAKEIAASLAEAKRAALDRVLAAEQLEDAGQKDTKPWKVAAAAARRAQLQVERHEARQKLRNAELAARKAPADAKARERVADARRAVGRVDERLKEPGTMYTRRMLPTYPAQSTGRRLAFARWLTDRANPLTSRVAVNHLWNRHFGQGLVPTMNDFGRNGRPPSHPALLDWLAAEFVDSGWSMKHIHKLIVTSNTYRQASTPDARNAAVDRDNKYLWHYPSRRLEAEAVRDAVFFVAGKLDVTMGGPDIDYPLGLTVPRRSLYFRHAAEKQMEFLQLFDGASVTECYERRHSIIPQQALALLNSELTLKHARLLARRIAGTTKGDGQAFTTSAFEHVLSRPPTTEELSECLNFLAEQTSRLAASKLTGTDAGDGSQPAASPTLRARENLVHAMMNHHEFVTIR